MQIFHPPQSINGMLPENVFYIADSANQTVAEGYIIPTYHPYLFPERPVNLYVNIRSQGMGEDMLLGALLGRARQVREQANGMRARLFAQVDPRDAAMMNFYMDNGFDASDALDVVRLNMPDAKPAAPMGYDMNLVPITNQQELMGFIQRMNTYRLNVLQPALLQRYMGMPHFFALYLRRGSDLVGEIAFTGDGQMAKLIGLYIAPKYRHMGLSKNLIAAGMMRLHQCGVSYVEGDVIRRNAAQYALANSCQATFVRTACFYPGINYD